MSVSKEFTGQIFLVFSIRDVNVNTFHNPFFQTTKAGAMRAFADLCSDPQSTIKRHASDFQLYQIGTFNTLSGELVPSLPEFLANATEFTGAGV